MTCFSCFGFSVLYIDILYIDMKLRHTCIYFSLGLCNQTTAQIIFNKKFVVGGILKMVVFHVVMNDAK